MRAARGWRLRRAVGSQDDRHRRTTVSWMSSTPNLTRCRPSVLGGGLSGSARSAAGAWYLFISTAAKPSPSRPHCPRARRWARPGADGRCRDRPGSRHRGGPRPRQVDLGGRWLAGSAGVKMAARPGAAHQTRAVSVRRAAGRGWRCRQLSASVHLLPYSPACPPRAATLSGIYVTWQSCHMADMPNSARFAR